MCPPFRLARAITEPLPAIIDPEPYLLSDLANEEKLGFSVAESIARSKSLHREQGGLFAGMLFHIVSPVECQEDSIVTNPLSL